MKKLSYFFIAVFFCFSTLCAASGYHVYHLDTLQTEGSRGTSINEKGTVVGQFDDADGVTYDFMWNKETGLTIIATDTVKGACPKVNNLGAIAGVLWERGSSFWNKDKQKIYTYDPEYNLLRTIQSPDIGSEYAVVAFNDNWRMLISNHSDPHQADHSCYWDGCYFRGFRKNDKIYFTAMNNHNFYLVASHDDSFFGPGLRLEGYNVEENRYVGIEEARKSCYFGIDINDKYEIIATDKKGGEGFFWSIRLGLVSLNSFIPAALNNQGEIVGTIHETGQFAVTGVGKKVTLLSHSILSLPDGFQGLTGVYNINDNGQIVATGMIYGKEQLLLLDPAD